MKTKSQKEIVKNILEDKGEVSNLWCIQNNIWRLSDIILHLRREGLEIKTIYNPGISKVTIYKLIPKATLW